MPHEGPFAVCRWCALGTGAGVSGSGAVSVLLDDQHVAQAGIRDISVATDLRFFELVARRLSSVGLLNSYWSLILAYSSFALPFSVWMLIGFFRSIPRDIDEAAKIDGASYLQTFFLVILPLARPGLVAVALFTFLIAWNSYLWALVLTTDASMHVLSVGVANMVGEYRVEWNELMAAAVIAAVPVMLLFSFLEKHLVNAITSGAVKG